jgi:hypothetical protein
MQWKRFDVSSIQGIKCDLLERNDGDPAIQSRLQNHLGSTWTLYPIIENIKGTRYSGNFFYSLVNGADQEWGDIGKQHVFQQVL